jgi:hypothetical protein
MLPLKAQFPTQANDSLNVYEDQLQMRNVGSCEEIQEPLLEVEYNEFLAKKYKAVNEIAIQRSLSSRIMSEESELSSSRDGGSQ